MLSRSLIQRFSTPQSLCAFLTTVSTKTPPANVSNNLVPGPDRPSTWWPHLPRTPGRRVIRMYPVRSRHRPRIVLVPEGCTNRPFYTIQIKSNLNIVQEPGIEQVGSWDPLPNKDHCEQLVALNLKRIAYWLGRGAEPSRRVAELLGLAGFLPIHPRTLLVAHRARLATKEYVDKRSSERDAGDQSKTTGEEENEADGNSQRPDSVWRRGNEPPWWWYHGIR